MDMKETINKNTIKRRWWLAGLLSYLVPGLGQVYNGELVKGFIIFILYSFWGSLFFIISLIGMKKSFPPFFAGLLFGFSILTFLFMLFIIIDAIRHARKLKSTYEREILLIEQLLTCFQE